MDIREKILEVYAPMLPMALLLMHGACFLLFSFEPKFYTEYCLLFEHLLNASGLFLVVLYALGDNWNFYARRAMFFLLVIWVTNLALIISSIINPTFTITLYDDYAQWYFMLLYVTVFGIFFWHLCNN